MGVVTKIAQKATGFLTNCSYKDLAILGVIALIPILAVILLIVKKTSCKHRKMDYYPIDDRRQTKHPKRIRTKTRTVDTYYMPRKRRVFYVKTKAPKKRRVKTKVVYTRADRSTMLATGLFGLGLGVMAHRAILEDLKKLH